MPIQSYKRFILPCLLLFVNRFLCANRCGSFFYFLLYELLSPFIEIFGILTMVLAFIFDLVNVPFMILFFAIYAVFGCILTLTAFFARTQTIDLKISAMDAMKAVLLCFFQKTVKGYNQFVGINIILARQACLCTLVCDNQEAGLCQELFLSF